jgi:hypothetical protein
MLCRILAITKISPEGRPITRIRMPRIRHSIRDHQQDARLPTHHTGLGALKVTRRVSVGAEAATRVTRTTAVIFHATFKTDLSLRIRRGVAGAPPDDRSLHNRRRRMVF